MTPLMQLTQNIDASLPLIKQCYDIDPTLKQELQQSIENKVLQVMLYGAYNAGKSTLINALLGREAAKVNDIPTTDSIDLYDWNGFHLLDTPGINAPIEHQKTTEEQLKRSSVMLFVIREGDQDVRDVYERLFDMLKRGKKVFIVLNHQLTNPDDKTLAICKVNDSIRKLAPNYQITQEEITKITLYPINARTAYNGRVKNSEKLLERSGYSQFLQGFRQWVQIQDNEQQHLEGLKQQINERWYNPAIGVLESRMGANDNENVINLKVKRSQLETEQSLLKLNSHRFITQQVNLLKSDVSSVLQYSASQAELDSKLQRVFIQLPTTIEKWLEDELGKIDNKLYLPVNHKHIQKDGNSSNQLTDTVLDTAKNALKDKENLKQAFLLGRKLKIPGLKGRWEKTLGQWAGKAAIAIQVVTFFYDIYKANADQEYENQRKRQQSTELYQAVDQICSIVTNDMTNAAYEAIMQTFQNQIGVVQQQIDENLATTTTLKADYEKLKQFKQQMSTIVW